MPRFTKEKYPFLFYLSGEIDLNLIEPNILAVDTISSKLAMANIKMVGLNCKHGSRRIVYPSKSFILSIDESKEKIWTDEFKKSHVFEKVNLVVLFPKGVTYIFQVVKPGNFNTVKAKAFKLVENRLVSYVDAYKPEMLDGFDFTEMKKAPNKKLSAIFSFGLRLLAFLKYAPKKTRILQPKERLKEFNCKYHNQSSLGVEILDINYFTESIQANPHIVRGHWHWYWYGKGKSKRKLRWIDPYMKKGYKKGAHMDKGD